MELIIKLDLKTMIEGIPVAEYLLRVLEISPSYD